MFDYDPGMMEENLQHEEYCIDRAEAKSLGILKQYYDDLYLALDGTCSAPRDQTRAAQEKYTLTLYIRSNCYYCRKVLKFLASEGKTIPMKDTQKDPGAREELIQIGHKGQVPCLVINDQALYESDAIIAWLKKNRDHY